MNISGIRTNAGFYDYNSIKINEFRNQQIQESKAVETPPSLMEESTDSRQQEQENVSVIASKEDNGAKEFADRYQPDVTYELKGMDSDISKLDIEKALSDMKKDQVLQQYQFFVGEKQQTADEPLSRYREDENFWL